jgi:Fe2+ transport system protein B
MVKKMVNLEDMPEELIPNSIQPGPQPSDLQPPEDFDAMNQIDVAVPLVVKRQAKRKAKKTKGKKKAARQAAKEEVFPPRKSKVAKESLKTSTKKSVTEAKFIQTSKKQSKQLVRESKENKGDNMAGKLNTFSLALSMGIVFGLGIFTLNLLSWLTGWGTAGMELIGSWYLGIAPTFVGSLIALGWGFGDGFIGGLLLAWLYNVFSKINLSFEV